jgi:all-trans-8'-apo-beta-carotenal 15,15'-oxygenase
MNTTQTRRQLLKFMAYTSAATCAFRASSATPQEAWRSSYAPFDNTKTTALDTSSLRIEGKLPAALRGTIYRNGPARFVLGESRLTHWFDGDGMIQAIRLGDGVASHTGRILQTPRRIEEDAKGRFLYHGFGTKTDNALPTRSPDSGSTGNINVLAIPQSKELFALWEGGSALSLDPQTLATKGFKTWSPETAGASFSAHPRVSPDGTIWNFGYAAGSGKLIIYHISAQGKLLRQTLLDVPQAEMVHDFAITEDYLVFLLNPLTFDSAKAKMTGVMGAYAWDEKAPLLAAVVNKSDWSMTMLELPNGGVFHLGNAFQIGKQINVSYSRSPNLLSFMNQLNHINGSAPVADSSGFNWTRVTIDLDKKIASQQSLGIFSVEFPRYDQRLTGVQSDLTVLMQRNAAMNPIVFGSDTVLVVSAKANHTVQRYNYGDDWIAEEHQYIAHPTIANESAGWVVGSAYHWPTEKTAFFVFEVNQLSKGPVAVCHLPYGLPLGLHGQFVAA